jgi:hypothetical protein
MRCLLGQARSFHEGRVVAALLEDPDDVGLGGLQLGDDLAVVLQADLVLLDGHDGAVGDDLRPDGGDELLLRDDNRIPDLCTSAPPTRQALVDADGL